jgi:hypothetical protein
MSVLDYADSARVVTTARLARDVNLPQATAVVCAIGAVLGPRPRTVNRLTVDEAADLHGLVNAVYQPHGCALCGATDLYIGQPHRCDPGGPL